MYPEWSDDVWQGSWIAARQPPDAHVCTVPTGFAACARVLHPVGGDPDSPDEEPTRWADVAGWSGVALGAESQFWQIALPEAMPAGSIPGGGWPASDVLGERDGRVLAAILREHTATPEDCWFGLWEGYGWLDPDAIAAFDERCPVVDAAERPGFAPHPDGGQPGFAPHPDGGPSTGPRVRLMGRDYLLYGGPVEAAMAFLPEQGGLADLWWPRERAWFVYGDVDLNSTYVAGPVELVDAVVACRELEAMHVDPQRPVPLGRGAIPDWLSEAIERAIADLLRERRAEVRASRLTLHLELEPRDFPPGAWWLTFRTDTSNRRAGGALLGAGDLERGLRRTIAGAIINALE